MTEFKDTVSVQLTLEEVSFLSKLVHLSGKPARVVQYKLDTAEKRLEHQHASNVLYAPQTPKTGSKPY
jgi:hypothetical protein